MIKAHFVSIAVCAHHFDAFSATLGSKLIIISAPLALMTSLTSTGSEPSSCIISSRAPSVDPNGSHLWTVTFISGISANLGTLFGSAKIASLKFFPTLRESMSNAATISISVVRYLPRVIFSKPRVASPSFASL